MCIVQRSYPYGSVIIHTYSTIIINITIAILTICFVYQIIGSRVFICNKCNCIVPRCHRICISVFFYNEETVKTSSGDYVSAFFWGPYDRMEKPYIKIATGDYNKVLREYDGNNSTTMIRFLQTMAHELSHYYQWLQSDWEEKSNQQIEKQARYYAKAVVYDYIHDSNPNYLKEKHEHYLNKNEILSILKDAEGSYEMLRFYFCYDQEFLEFKKFYVASYSEEFIFGIKEDDFILNGFQIRKLSD